MIDEQLLNIACLALGTFNGLMIGWALWRRPLLNYKTGEQND